MVTSGIPATATRSPADAESAGTRVERLGAQQLGDLDAGGLAVRRAPGHLLAAADHPGPDPAQRDPAEEAGRVQVGDVRLQRGVRVVGRRRHGAAMVSNSASRPGSAGSVAVGRAGAGGPAGAAGGVDHRQVEQRRGGGLVQLQLVGQLQQQLQALVRRPRRSGRPGGRSCSRPAPPAARRPGSCAARTGSAAAGPRSRPPAAAHRPPWTARARPRRRSRRAPGCRRRSPSCPCQAIAVCLARIVMPFSRSRSPESRTRSTTAARSPNAPDARSMASTSVVLPWSTCATMATLRSSAPVSRPRAAPGVANGSVGTTASRVDAAEVTVKGSGSGDQGIPRRERSLTSVPRAGRAAAAAPVIDRWEHGAVCGAEKGSGRAILAGSG